MTIETSVVSSVSRYRLLWHIGLYALRVPTRWKFKLARLLRFDCGVLVGCEEEDGDFNPDFSNRIIRVEFIFARSCFKFDSRIGRSCEYVGIIGTCERRTVETIFVVVFRRWSTTKLCFNLISRNILKDCRCTFRCFSRDIRSGCTLN